VVAFEAAYHGLGYGALAVTHREDFRRPFLAQLNPHVRFMPYPFVRRDRADGAGAATARCLDQVDSWLGSPAGAQTGAVLVEPIQGRAGILVPPPTFLVGLREICTRRGVLLVADEILTGLGRTGRWFACEHAGVVPDLLCVGKALGGGLPLSACIGTVHVMDAWGPSSGEARHTSTFLGNPLACAAACALLDVLRGGDWLRRVSDCGSRFGAALQELSSLPGVIDVRGMGLLWGLELANATGGADAARAFDVVRRTLRGGILLLADGTHRNVLAFMPPYALADAQREAAFDVIRTALAETRPAGSAGVL
jgi:4-aminobutyrate aminotransferase/(S)-3-amino-2-methylpropionate transaminase